MTIADCGLRMAWQSGLRIGVAAAALVCAPAVADAQDRPAVPSTQERPSVGPERPFQLAPRIEKTLPNGLRVIVTRQTAVPKVSITLTVLSGYSSDTKATLISKLRNS